MNDPASVTLVAPLSAALSTFGLILLAEMGDKSQLVCMTLAARHHHAPVLAGSISAFVILNSLAVVFGVALAQWIPGQLLALGVALLFGVYGVLALRAADGAEAESVTEAKGHGVFLTTLAMILLAEMGDKTQLAVAGLASTLSPLAVWVGATLALSLTSVLGVVVGCRLLRAMPLVRLHQASGVLFLVLAGVALAKGLGWI